MLSKILMGVSAASVIALLVVGNMLLSAKEANGALQQGIEEAAGINDRQRVAMASLQSNHDNLLVQIEQQRVKAEIATASMERTEEELIATTADFETRINVALEGMSDEDLECASEFVPAGLIDSLHDDASSPVGP